VLVLVVKMLFKDGRTFVVPVISGGRPTMILRAFPGRTLFAVLLDTVVDFHVPAFSMSYYTRCCGEQYRYQL
jgi:hypothetical protein